MNPQVPSSPLAAQLGGMAPPQDPLGQAPDAAAGLLGGPDAGGAVQALLASLLGQGLSQGQAPPGEEMADLQLLDSTAQAQATGNLDAGEDMAPLDGASQAGPLGGGMGGMGDGGGLADRLMAALAAAQPKPPVPTPPAAAGMQQPGMRPGAGPDMGALLGGMKGPPPGGSPFPPAGY
jgi:hypothetical protein